MTVTVLPTRRSTYTPPLRRRAPQPTAPEEAALTVSVVVTLTGENRFVEAARVLDTLRQATAELTGAQVSLRPALAVATAPAAPSASTVDAEPAENTDEVLIMVESREVRYAGRTIPFTRIEFDLLRFLAEHPRQVFTREQLLRHVWGFAHGGHRTVDVHIRRLRAKLGDREVATTVRGVGYRLADGAKLRVVRLVQP